ncbi:MAG: dihydropteroate synthase [Clostridiales bacterium]|nr:dihydropteroate synthase [Clostridiales bacterium]
MKTFTPFTLNMRGKLVAYDKPAVMGILNITPDSFFSGSRTMLDNDIELRVRTLVDQGTDIIDIGGYSSRPGACDVTPDEELRRLETGISIVKRLAPDIPISVDTFRASVAHKAVTSLGADIINDISGGQLDDKMFETVVSTRAPYVLTHMRGTPADMQQHTDYNDVTADVINRLSTLLAELSLSGAGDVIIDPGFGFSKTVSQNFELLAHLELFKALGRPVLAGLSRKSMIYRTLDCQPCEALNGTTVVNTLALERGASILRVHDVKAAREAITLLTALNSVDTTKK